MVSPSISSVQYQQPSPLGSPVTLGPIPREVRQQLYENRWKPRSNVKPDRQKSLTDGDVRFIHLAKKDDSEYNESNNSNNAKFLPSFNLTLPNCLNVLILSLLIGNSFGVESIDTFGKTNDTIFFQFSCL